MITLIICIVIYVISVYVNWDYTKKAHTKRDDEFDGRFSYVSPTMGDVVFTLMPLMNSVTAILIFFDSPYRRKNGVNFSDTFSKRFFKL